jgi:hypothetical protein
VSDPMITVSKVLTPRPSVELRLPYRPGNREALRGTLGPGVHLQWDREYGCWRLARRHMLTLVDALVEAGQPVRVEVTVRGKAAGAERCDARCRDAEGDDCTCECGGRWHGAQRWPNHWAHVKTDETTIGVEVKYVTHVYEVHPS